MDEPSINLENFEDPGVVAQDAPYVLTRQVFISETQVPDRTF
jgi:hypothetical protein